jgi:ribonucleoside-diphosphate reductase alpha chain
MSRERLVNRRPSETFAFECAGLRYIATIGRFADGRLGEIFLTNTKAGSDADTNARDAAIAASIALQHGADVDALRKALCRDSAGCALGPLGTALDILVGRSMTSSASTSRLVVDAEGVDDDRDRTDDGE